MEILECAYPLNISLMMKTGQITGGFRGATASMHMAATAYDTVQIYSAYAQTVRVFLGNGTAGTRNVAGVVNVVDSGRSIVEAGFGALAFDECVPIEADITNGKRPCIALKNTTSDKRLVLEKMSIDQPGLIDGSVMPSGNIILEFLTQAEEQQLGVGNAPKSKLFGSVATGAQLKKGARTPNKNNALWMEAIGTWKTYFVVEFKKPIVVVPGGTVALNGNVNVSRFAAAFDFYMV